MSHGNRQSKGDDATPAVRADAEWAELEAVRVHRPGLETFIGILDPDPNLFLDEFSLVEAQREHERLVEDLRQQLDTADSIHFLHDDLNHDGQLDALLSSRVSFDLDGTDQPTQLKQTDELWNRLHDLSAYSKLQAIASNVQVHRELPEGAESDPVGGYSPNRRYASSMSVERPLSNLYFQRDQQFVTQAGVVICCMNKNTRQMEVQIARAAWEALDGQYDVEIVADLSETGHHDVTRYVPERDDITHTTTTVEGGDFYPAGDFSLLGVSAKIDDGRDYPEEGIPEEETEHVLRTSYAAGHKLLMEDAFGADEVGLVRAPFTAARRAATDGETAMDIMHLDTWFNIVDDDLAVSHGHLVNNTEVDVYRRVNDNDDQPYELRRADVNFGSYIREEHGFEIVNVAEYVDPDHENAEAALKAITNFLTLGPRTVLAVRFDETGAGVMDRFVQALEEEYGVDVVPDDTGRKILNLRAGYGAIHCMTTPIRRTL